jgi:hypothetical protein
MPNKIDLSGQRFGRLVAMHAMPPKKKGGSTRWLCRCDCGNESTPGTAQLRRGRAKSCGCFQAEAARSANATHGQIKSSEYRAWCAMRSRCNTKSNISFKNYGGRGISVCKRWGDFLCFLSDMGPQARRHALPLQRGQRREVRAVQDFRIHRIVPRQEHQGTPRFHQDHRKEGVEITWHPASKPTTRPCAPNCA